MSDDIDALKAGLEVMYEPVRDIVDKIAGPAAEEFGLALRDHVRVFRLKGQIRLLKKVKEMIAESGLPPQQVPMNILLPSLESAEIEEDETLQEKWAALISNAATKATEVRRVYVEFLRELSHHDALVLEAIHRREILPNDQVTPTGAPLKSKYSPAEARSRTLETTLSVENLTRMGLIVLRQAPDAAGYPQEIFMLTFLGSYFLKACTAPSKKDLSAESAATAVG